MLPAGESWETDGNEGEGFDDDDDDFDFDEHDNTNDDDDFSPTRMVEEYQKWIKAVDKTVQALEKKQKSLQNELEKAEQLQGYTARADLLKSNLYLFTPGVRTATVQDWEQDGAEVEVTLDDAHDSATDEVEAL